MNIICARSWCLFRCAMIITLICFDVWFPFHKLCLTTIDLDSRAFEIYDPAEGGKPREKSRWYILGIFLPWCFSGRPRAPAFEWTRQSQAWPEVWMWFCGGDTATLTLLSFSIDRAGSVRIRKILLRTIQSAINSINDIIIIENNSIRQLTAL